MEAGRSDEASQWPPMSLDALVRDLADHLPEQVVLLDEDGAILWGNLTAEAVLGWRREEWVGRNIGEILHPDDAVMAQELLVSARASGPGVKEPVTYRVASTHDGWIVFEAVASTVQLATGRSVLIVSARVKGRSRRDEVIAGEVGERMSFVFDEAVIGMAKVGLDGRVLRANRALGARLGTDPASLHGVALGGLVLPTDRPALSEALATAAASELAGPVEVEGHLGSEPVAARLHLTQVPDWLGTPLYLLVQVTG